MAVNIQLTIINLIKIIQPLIEKNYLIFALSAAVLSLLFSSFSYCTLLMDIVFCHILILARCNFGMLYGFFSRLKVFLDREFAWKNLVMIFNI